MTTTQQQHKTAIEQACYYLARFGYLRNEDIASLMFKNHKSKDRMSRRLTQDMADDGLIVSRRDHAYDPAHHALSLKGARLARAITGADIQHGTDLLRFISGHRDAANRVAIQAMGDGKEVLTDREIQTRAGRAFGGKVPDCLVIDEYEDDGGYQRRDYHWVEVENSKRGGRDLQKLAAWIRNWAFPKRNGYLSEYRDGYLAKVVLAVATPHANRIRERLIAELRKQATTKEDLTWLELHAGELIEQVEV